MLTITILGKEYYDEANEEFVYPYQQTLELNHSLVSLSKWESKWCKPFLSSKEKTYEETLDYIKCMVNTPNVDPDIFNYLSQKNVDDINNYIYAPMTATTVNDDKKGKKNSEILTSELIYYWMIALQIPFECQHWHLNRLLTLIRVCNAKNEPPKKMSKRETINRYAALNEARRKQLNSKG